MPRIQSTGAVYQDLFPSHSEARPFCSSLLQGPLSLGKQTGGTITSWKKKNVKSVYLQEWAIQGSQETSVPFEFYIEREK